MRKYQKILIASVAVAIPGALLLNWLVDRAIEDAAQSTLDRVAADELESALKREYEESEAKYPHCDELVLHAPGECKYCDLFPARQSSRIKNLINFTGHRERGCSPCPSEKRRAFESINRWGGNRAVKPGEAEADSELGAWLHPHG